MVLANIFIRREIWGPEGAPESAVYQLERAQEAEKRFAQENSKYKPSPGLHQQLAEAYVHLDKSTDAWDQYATASEAYLQPRNVKEARQMLNRAKSLNLPLDRERLGTFADLDDPVKKKSNTILGKPTTGVV